MASIGSRISLAILFSTIYIVCQASLSSGQSDDKRVEIRNLQLPEAAAEGEKYSAYQPAQPYSITGAILSRTVFQGKAPDGNPIHALGNTASNEYSVEVLDWAIPAGKDTGTTALPGAAFFDVRSGSGTLVIGHRQQQIASGATFSASQGEPVEIKNVGEWLLRLRVYVVKD